MHRSPALLACLGLLLVTAPGRGDESAFDEPVRGWIRPAAYAAPLAPGAAESLPPVPEEALQKTAPVSPPGLVSPTRNDTSFAKRLNELEARLGRRVAQPPSEWHFDDLQREAADLLSLANQPAQRDAVLDVVRRAERFATLAGRLGDEGLAATPTTPVASTLKSQRTASQSVVPTQIEAASVAPVGTRPVAPEYDAIGELRPVVSKRPGAPKYALVGDNGRVITFLSPSAGLDLDPLLGKRVGARGSRGYMPEYRAKHLAAQQVQPVGTLLR